ncbi:MAG TPA: D-sedoheptulose 7-phosphate isomerase [Terracidiphilus sp.]|jgi:D-sedoheptulose 7-phosphate isomerase
MAIPFLNRERLNNEVNFEKAEVHVRASLREGADLRLKLAGNCGRQIVEAALLISDCLAAGGKLLLFGNGGSAADAQHLAAEFVGRFVVERPGLAAIALTTDSSILTAVANDYGFERVFARQIEALGRPGDVAIGISTSGNSPNVIEAVNKAKEQDLKTISLVGKDGGALARCVDLAITVSSTNTARVQECHIAIGHILCELVENELSEK